jgi:hypothetical protein
VRAGASLSATTDEQDGELTKLAFGLQAEEEGINL